MKFQGLSRLTVATFLTVSCLFSTQSFGSDCVPVDSTTGFDQDLAQDVTKAAEKVFDCRATFLASLKSRDPEGYKIWDSLSAESKKQLENLIQCGTDGQVRGTDAATLVHESLHLLASEKGLKTNAEAYLLLNGKWVGFQEDQKGWLYENSRGQALKVMSQDERQIYKTKTYLYESGYQSLGSLLDELNAYTRDLKTALHYPSQKDQITGEREGSIDMVVFSLRYLEAMKKNSPDYYKTLMTNHDLKTTVKALFEDAYSVYNQSCERTDLNMDDMRSIRALQTESSRAALKTIFGDRAPAISPRCVATAKLEALIGATPIEYPNREAAMAADKGEVAAIPAASPTSVNATNASASQPKCDPSKPCATLYSELQKDGSMKLAGDLKGNHVEQIFSPNGTKAYFWNGKAISEKEYLKRIISDPELLELNNNSQIVEKSASASP